MVPALAAVAFAISLQAEVLRSRQEIGSIAKTFVEALGARDGARLATVSQGSGRPGFGLVAVADLMERSRCAVVDGYDFSIDDLDEQKASVTIALNGSAETIGAFHSRFALPKFWSLELVHPGDRWLVSRAEPHDWMIGRLIAEAPDDAARETLLNTADDALSAIRTASEIVSFTGAHDVARGFDVLSFAEATASRRGDAPTISFVQRRRSRLYFMMHRSSDAIQEAEKGVCTAEESGDADKLADALFGVGVASWLAGNDAEALDTFRRVAAMLHALTDSRPAIRAVYMSAVVLRKRDPRTALSYLVMTDELSTEYDWYPGSVDAASMRGDLYSDIGDFDTAAQWYRVVLARSPRTLAGNYAVAANTGLAMCAIERGNLSDAKVQLERLVSQTGLGDVAGQLGRVLTRLGKYDEAERQLELSIARAEHDEQWKVGALARTYLAELRLAQHRDDEALRIALAVLEAQSRPEKTRGQTDESFEEWETRLVAARALRHLHRFDEAIPMLQRAIELVEDERATAATDEVGNARFFDDKIAPYTELVDILVARGRYRDALLVSERMRARSLRDALTTGHVDSAKWMTEAERQSERALEERLVAANRAFLEAHGRDELTMRLRRDESRAALNQFREDLYIKYPQLRVRRPLDAVRLEIPPALARIVFVEYVVRGQDTLVLTARRSATGSVVVSGKRIAIGRDALTRRVERLLSAMGRRESTSRDTRALYDLLLAPIESEISQHEICIIPNDTLWRLPFHALTDQTGNPVIERHALFYAPALATLGMSAPRHGHAARELLALGDPRLDLVTTANVREQMRGGSFTPLPSAAVEVREIARLYPAPTSEVLTGAAARESTFKSEAANYRVLHLATHGVFDDSAPMYSSLLLARSVGDHEDGLLEAREIAGLSLHADVVVLSACDTARGRIGAGEGVTGLSWAFLAAGCPTTVVSQWKAESRATARLMIDFHRHLLAGDPAPEALRKAQLALRRDPRYANPFYWAPFIVLGSP
jgi:CHAT domain-containing protein/predicted negative regulator of RcsB-dependent stress response